MLRLLPMMVLLLASPSALASFTPPAPRSAHLLPRDEPLRFRLVQEPPAAKTDPLPELPPPDPYARRLNLKEVGVGAAMVLAADVVSALVGGGVGGLVWLAGADPIVAIVAGFVTFLGADLFLAPAGAAIGAYSASPKGGNNGMLGAVLGAGMAQLAYTAVFTGVGVGFGVLVRVFSPQSLTTQAGALLVSLALLVVHTAVLPVGASLGIHWAAPEPESRPLPLATSPHDLYAQALLRPAPALALRF